MMATQDRAEGGIKQLTAGFLDFWNRFWFSPADPTPLGVLRILCGLMVLYVHLAYCYDLLDFHGPHAWLDKQIIDEYRENAPFPAPMESWVEQSGVPRTPEETAYFNKWGMLPSQALAEQHPHFAKWFQGHPYFSIWFHVTDPTWIWICHGCILFIMLLFTIGLATPVTSVLTWLGMLSYIQRAPTALFGMDTIMNLLVFYLMIGPSGAALSVDRLLAHWWQKRRARQEGIPEPRWTPPAPSVRANLALRLLQVHVCLVYVASGLSKLQGQAWWNGTAIWSTMANYEFSPMRYQLYMNFIYLLVDHRWLWELFMSGTAIFTLVFEIGFPVFMFLAYVWNSNIRWFVIAGAVFLHLGIAFFMGLVCFSLMMLVAVASFVPADSWRYLLGGLYNRKDYIRLKYIEGNAA
jgi:hypothetical protein